MPRVAIETALLIVLSGFLQTAHAFWMKMSRESQTQTPKQAVVTMTRICSTSPILVFLDSSNLIPESQLNWGPLGEIRSVSTSKELNSFGNLHRQVISKHLAKSTSSFYRKTRWHHTSNCLSCHNDYLIWQGDSWMSWPSVLSSRGVHTLEEVLLVIFQTLDEDDFAVCDGQCVSEKYTCC